MTPLALVKRVLRRIPDDVTVSEPDNGERINWLINQYKILQNNNTTLSPINPNMTLGQIKAELAKLPEDKLIKFTSDFQLAMANIALKRKNRLKQVDDNVDTPDAKVSSPLVTIVKLILGNRFSRFIILLIVSIIGTVLITSVIYALITGNIEAAVHVISSFFEFLGRAFGGIISSPGQGQYQSPY